MSREPFFAVLPKVIGGVDEDLVVEGLCGEPFFCWRVGKGVSG